ncbi:MAG TPA: hypothetical protein VFO55_00810 [Gemmatimonadaceae bacterium]|nr:hypothetical protein [Gemmatimonadaceae bacterium]
MTDDFRLFDDPDDGGRAIDPDIALISAYLARELSPMQVLAVEDRLANDAEFRAAMQPVIDAWAAPVASLTGSAPRAAPLTAREKSESWRRFQHSHPADESAAPNLNRKVSMKRVAAMIGLTVLPVVSFAQIVAYAASHQDAPGHAIATRIVASFTTAPAIAPAAQPPAARVATPASPVADIPLGQPLKTPAPARLPKAPAAAELLPVPMNPDRARVAALVKEHHARVISGDTAVEYVVMVVDASSRYLWSTIGNGNLQIEIAGDTRTPAERRTYNQEFRRELTGNAAVVGGAGGGRGGTARAMLSDSGRLRVLADTLRYPAGVATGTARGVGGGRGVGGRARAVGGDTAVVDSAKGAMQRAVLITERPAYTIARRDSSGETRLYVGLDSARTRAGAPGSYRVGWVFSGSALLNAASGLQELGNGESGIQGLKSASLAGADTYQFSAGELAPRSLRVVVVRLTAGTSWGRRFQ